MNPDDSATFWGSYKTTEQRAGPLPITSTPLKTPRSQRVPESLNVTTILLDDEQDENRNLCSSIQSLHISCRNCRELRMEVQELREKLDKQNQYITYLKTLHLTSELESSESQHGNGSSVSSSGNKIARVQRVTPTKRETTSSSTSTSSSSSTPQIRNNLQQATTPRSARAPSQHRGTSRNRTPTATPIITRNVRPVTNRTSSSSDSPVGLVTPSVSTRRSRLPPTNRIPQSEPMGMRPRQLHFESQTLPPPRQTTTTSARRSQSRRRLFANETPTDVHRNLQHYQRTQSENAIEHLNISPVKDDHWAQACPPRVHLERNRPEFIERVEARQSIIRAASEKRAEIEHRKRVAARAVASGQKSRESVLRDLCADSTTVKAFYEKDMREITLKNIRKSQSYQNRMWQRMATVDKHANRIIAQTHSLRARSTSRNRYQ